MKLTNTIDTTSSSPSVTDSEPHNQSLITDIKRRKIPTFNGIPISEEVIRQLEEASGLPIERISNADIQSGVIGFEGDAQIIEHEKGGTLNDKIYLTWGEELPEPQHTFTGHAALQNHTIHTHPHLSPKETEEHEEKPTTTISHVERYLNSLGSKHHSSMHTLH